jgi:hypothetical protein
MPTLDSSLLKHVVAAVLIGYLSNRLLPILFPNLLSFLQGARGQPIFRGNEVDAQITEGGQRPDYNAKSQGTNTSSDVTSGWDNKFR